MMHTRTILFAFFLAGFAGVAQAREPLIQIYNYTAPIPALELSTITPQNQQTFESSSPTSAEVSFTESIVPEKSDLKVSDQYNNVISTAKSMPKDNRITVSLPDHLLSGSYRIDWTATCACAGAATITGTSYFTVY